VGWFCPHSSCVPLYLVVAASIAEVHARCQVGIKRCPRDLPNNQVSWHIPDSELPLFDFLPQYAGKWDMHDTSTTYARALTPGF
jgi:hypothetical protein